nr:PCRF domain-containing protein [Gemmatimonadaceae bacterium]
MSIRARLADALHRAESVEQELLDPAVLRDARQLATLGREHQRLQEVVRQAAALAQAERELAGARELAAEDDPDLAREAQAEVARLDAVIAALEQALVPLLVPRDPLDDRPAILEIRAGTGGDEAALFAGDLWR